MTKFLSLLLTFNFFSNAYAQENSSTTQRPLMEVSLGIGNLTKYVRRVQTNQDGSKNTFEFNPFLVAALDYNFTPMWGIRPSFGITVPESGRDDSLTKFDYYLLADGLLNIEQFSFKAGAGLYFNFIKGKGGEQVLRNGTSSSSFTVPSGTSTARNVIADFGFDWRFLPEFAAQLQIFLFNPHDSVSRSVTYTLGVSYFWDISPPNR